jgi:hypothetical protein
MTIKDIRPPEDIPDLLENVSRVTEGLDDAGIWRHKKKDGSIIYVEIVSHTINFNDRRAEMVRANDRLPKRRTFGAQQKSSIANGSKTCRFEIIIKSPEGAGII